MRYAVASALLALLSGAVLVGYVGYKDLARLTRDRIQAAPFLQDVWSSNPKDEDGVSPRLAMVPDLVGRHLRPGTARGEVEALLGKPTEERWSASHPHPGWDLGRSPGTTESTCLCISFDAEQRITAVYAPYWGGNGPYQASAR